jgi:hypothetical protein
MDWVEYGALIYHEQAEFSNGRAGNVDGLKLYSIGEVKAHVVRYNSVC